MYYEERTMQGGSIGGSDTGPAGPAMSNAMLKKELEVERRWKKQVLVLQLFAGEQGRERNYLTSSAILPATALG